MAQNINKKVSNNFFARMKNKHGDNFLDYIKSDELARGTKHVFRELARGQIDLNVYGKYFLDKRVLQSCIDVAFSEYDRAYYQTMGLDMLDKYYESNGITKDPNFITILMYNRMSLQAYKVIYDGFKQFEVNKNINYLVGIANNLQQYRLAI